MAALSAKRALRNTGKTTLAANGTFEPNVNVGIAFAQHMQHAE